MYLQFALLYTTVQGERRIRLHTLALPVTHSLGTTFRGADLDAYMTYVAKKVASQVRRGGGVWDVAAGGKGGRCARRRVC